MIAHHRDSLAVWGRLGLGVAATFCYPCQLLFGFQRKDLSDILGKTVYEKSLHS